MATLSKYEAIVIGTSAGGLYALIKLLGKLPSDYPLPILVVQHRAKDQKHLLEDVLQPKLKLKIRQAEEKEKIQPSVIYTAPPDYHLLVEKSRILSLSSDPPVMYSRPSIDVLFESAAAVYKNKLIGIILTGANQDGSAGIIEIKSMGGLTIAQSPEEALFPIMPRKAIETNSVDHVWNIEEITNFLLGIQKN